MFSKYLFLSFSNKSLLSYFATDSQFEHYTSVQLLKISKPTKDCDWPRKLSKINNDMIESNDWYYYYCYHNSYTYYCDS